MAEIIEFYRRIQLSQETMKDGTAKFGSPCTKLIVFNRRRKGET